MSDKSFEYKLSQQIFVNSFKPRSYQLPLMRAMELEGYTRALLVWPRRSGKDILAFNYCIRQLLKRTGSIYYIFPTYSQGKKVLWDGIDSSGKRILDYIPKQLVESLNSTEMKIRLKNGSLFQVVGSENYNSLMGTNPMGCVFSEYALQDPAAYQYIRPILMANGGWVIFISTPRGKNHLYNIYEIASSNPEHWYCSRLTVEDTGHVSLEDIQREISDGTMSEDLVQQEFYCSFDLGVEGAYYTKYLDRMKVNQQIGIVPWEPGHKVHSAWDLGVRDSTCIILFQVIGQTIRIIDCYEGKDVGLDHYIKVIQQKPYVYGKHFAPHDIGVREFTSGLARIDIARNMGISFTIVPNLSIQDGIEAVRAKLPKMWIDDRNCKPLVKALESYRKDYDSKNMVYKENPRHDWACFVGETQVLTRSGMRPIMDITEKDYILTKDGWLPCSTAKKTGINAPLVEVTFQDNTIVKCTPEHLFLTESGWISAENLEKGSKIQSSLTKLPSILMDIFIDCGLATDILQKADQGCIEMFGKMRLGKFLVDVTYIIETLIQRTTVFGTLNASQLKSILHYLNQLKAKLVKKLEMPQLNGIDLKKEENGIGDMLCGLSHGQLGQEKKDCVCFVTRNMIVLSEKMDMHKNSVTKIAKPLIIECVTRLNEKSDVYCINVPNVHHFSLSNGAIVHNSHWADSMRYLVLGLGKMGNETSAEELDRRFMEAKYGNKPTQGFFAEPSDNDFFGGLR